MTGGKKTNYSKKMSLWKTCEKKYTKVVLEQIPWLINHILMSKTVL